MLKKQANWTIGEQASQRVRRKGRFEARSGVIDVKKEPQKEK